MASVLSKIFAITGGASGIGAATARLLAQRGASILCICDISSTNFASLTQSIHSLNPSTKLSNWVSNIVAAHGDLHGAANVAGIAQGAFLRQQPTIIEETDEDWSKIIKVNLDGVFYCTRAEVKAMKSFREKKICIVNVSSVASFYHRPDVYAYGTSKGASACFTNCVASDIWPLRHKDKLFTNTPLLPKFAPNMKTLSEAKDAYRKEGFSIIEPEDVARTIVWLLSEDSKPVYGTNINVGACLP
ncbi:short chain dehydrogenase/oxidoreductase CpoX2 [Bisporella sp. PMI_857]|nr:short chain dehydrogenase/oxidoreductase CpoX2 [Bisporella sp. PMI_857]